MKVVEHFTGSTKGPLIEDLITDTAHFCGVFDGVTNTREWFEHGKTMGQWAAFLAGQSLEELPADATIADFAVLATDKMANLRKEFGLLPTDRLATSAIVFPKRRPLEIWSIGDSHYGYTRKDGTWVSCPQGKYYDEVTLAFRNLTLTQEIMEKGELKTREEKSALAHLGWDCVRGAISKQMLWTNHPDPKQELGFGTLNGTPVPPHHYYVHKLPDDAAEVVLCSDGLPEAAPTAEAGKAMLKELREADPLLIGRNPRKFRANKGGFILLDGSLADYYDDVAYLRVKLT